MRGTPIPILSSIAELAAGSDAWIVDIWGVMHNGAQAHGEACAACRRFRAGGGRVALLSNAPRPFAAVVRQLDALGVPRSAYDCGITSGDMTRALLETMIAAGPRGPLLHIGPERDLGLFAGLDVRLGAAEQAETVVCSGLFDDTRETPDDYAPLFSRLLARGVPMICANPDIKVERGSRLIYCAGALAQAYAARGGKVAYAGKPHRAIYRRALHALAALTGAGLAKERVLAIGDGLDTDLAGAHVAGLRSVFIASAVHLPEGLSACALAKLFKNRPFTPIAALPALAW
jgi:HAD superfamily hydrolase (TIGR01459 family)